MDWETLNTQKIITYFFLSEIFPDAYGSKIRFKCHQPISRINQTLDGEKCVNWQILDSFGEKFYLEYLDTYIEQYQFSSSHKNTGYHLGQKLIKFQIQANKS